MLCLYTGTPGSGKSLHAAKLIRDRLKWAKCPVLANFDVSHDLPGYGRWFTYVSNDSLTPDYLRDFARAYWDGGKVREDEIVLLVDEAQLLFNSRDWNHYARMDWVEFLSQHRHYGYMVVMMTQTDRMLDRQIRSLAEYEFHHRKVANFGTIGKISKLLLLNHQLFLCVQTYHGLSGNAGRIGTQTFIGTKSLYAVYDSYSTFTRVADAAEAGSAGDPAEDAPATPGKVLLLSKTA